MAKRLGDRLLEAGLITAAHLAHALAHQRITGLRLGDCLVELKLLDEVALLRFLASDLKTRYVTAEKLSKVRVEPRVLESLAVRLAEAQECVPIACDFNRKIVSLVMATPQNTALVQEICEACHMDEAVAFLATRASIAAAIRRLYYADNSAFESLSQTAEKSERTVSQLTPLSHSLTPLQSVNPFVATNQSAQITQVFGLPRTVAERDYLEMIELLIGEVEAGNNRRGHSAAVARWCQLLAERLQVNAKDFAPLALAALLHDFGKPVDQHYSHWALNAETAQKMGALATASFKNLENIRLPYNLRGIVGEQYESFDGRGVPRGLSAESIHLGARILAVVDAYWHLTRQNQPALSTNEALLALKRQAGKRFDPKVVDALGALLTGEQLRQQLECEGRQVLLADGTSAKALSLADALGRAGLPCLVVDSLQSAADAFLSDAANVVVLALSLGAQEVNRFVQLVRSRPEVASVPVLVLGEPESSVVREKLLLAGVTAFIENGFSPDFAATTILASFREAVAFGAPAKVVRGSFDELGLKQVLGILANGKSGRLVISTPNASGYLHLESGRVISAEAGPLVADEAMREWLESPQGDFEYDADALPTAMPNLDLALGNEA